MKRLKTAIFNLIRDDDINSLSSSIFDGFIIILISLNVVLIILDTFNIPENIKAIFFIIEFFSIIIFSIEYILRIWTADLLYPDLNKFSARLKYCISMIAIVDLLSIVPFFIPFLIPFDLRTLRLFRLLRLLRLFKFNRYTNAFSNIGKVIKTKSTQLISVMIAILLLMTISSVIMYNVEHPIQPENFENAFSGFWWALNTITTVGYGDIYPISTLGKILSGIISLLGIGLIAVPTGIISAGFIESTEEEKIEHNRMDSIRSDLLILKDLYDKNIINEEEYERQKNIILDK